MWSVNAFCVKAIKKKFDPQTFANCVKSFDNVTNVLEINLNPNVS